MSLDVVDASRTYYTPTYIRDASLYERRRFRCTISTVNGEGGPESELVLDFATLEGKKTRVILSPLSPPLPLPLPPPPPPPSYRHDSLC